MKIKINEGFLFKEIAVNPLEPGLARNLVALPKLLKKAYEVFLYQDVCIIDQKQTQLFFRVNVENVFIVALYFEDLFKLNESPETLSNRVLVQNDKGVAWL